MWISSALVREAKLALRVLCGRLYARSASERPLAVYLHILQIGVFP